MARIRQEAPTKMTATSNKAATTAMVTISEILKFRPIRKIKGEQKINSIIVMVKNWVPQIKVLYRNPHI